MRRNWARWFIIVWTVIGLHGLPRQYQQFTFSFASVRNLIQFILTATATILLLCPQPRRWFNRTSEAIQPDLGIACVRTKLAKIVAWSAGLYVLLMIPALASNPTWPLAIAVTGMATMVPIIYYGILKR